MKKTDTLPATLSALLQEYSIAEGIQMAEQQVRENPAKALCRHSLFQLLCVAGDWSRALHQLQLCARMEANYTQEARLYRELVRCEMFRHTVFRVNNDPVFFCRSPFGWSHCWRHSPVMTIPVRLINTVIPHWKP